MATLWRFPQKNHVKREAEENGQKEMAITAAGQKLLVGPRPLLPEDQPSNMSLRLSVRPGISGWAQVNGAKLVSKEEKEKLDEWYVRNASLWVDLQIALATIKVILKGRVSLAEISADTEQVRSKNIGLHRTNTAI